MLKKDSEAWKLAARLPRRRGVNWRPVELHPSGQCVKVESVIFTHSWWMTLVDLRVKAGLPGNPVQLEAERLRSGVWCVRPVGALGTCGFHPVPWEAFLCKAPNAEQAKTKARNQQPWATYALPA